MKCPKCNNQAISRFRFVIKNIKKPFTCQNCGTILKLRKPKKPKKRNVYIILMIIGFLLGFGYNRIKKIFDINISWLSILLIILLVGIVIEVVAEIIIWRHGVLEEVEEK